MPIELLHITWKLEDALIIRMVASLQGILWTCTVFTMIFANFLNFFLISIFMASFLFYLISFSLLFFLGCMRRNITTATWAKRFDPERNTQTSFWCWRGGSAGMPHGAEKGGSRRRFPLYHGQGSWKRREKERKKNHLRMWERKRGGDVERERRAASRRRWRSPLPFWVYREEEKREGEIIRSTSV